jgi:hypothetical protein
MAQIVLPYIATDGLAASAAGFAGDLAAPAAPATSLIERNGLLDQGNLSQRLGHRYFRLGSAAVGGTVAAASEWVYHKAAGANPLPDRDRLLIPGAGVELWSPWDFYARFAWSITFRSNFAYNPPWPHTPPDFILQLLINGALQTPRALIPAQYSNTAAPHHTFTVYKYTWNGHWNSVSGSFFNANQVHRAGIGLYCGFPNGAEIYPFVHFRVMRASFSYLLLKK